MRWVEMEIKWWDEWVERRWTWDEISRVIIVYTLDDGMIDWVSGDGDKMEIIWDDMIWYGDEDEMEIKMRWDSNADGGWKRRKEDVRESSRKSNGWKKTPNIAILYFIIITILAKPIEILRKEKGYSVNLTTTHVRHENLLNMQHIYEI